MGSTSIDDSLLSRILSRIVDPKLSISVGCGRLRRRLGNDNGNSDPSTGGPLRLRIHATFFVLLSAEFLTSLRYVNSYPMYILLTVLIYGPILLTTALIHECGHAFAARRLGGRIDPPRDDSEEEGGLLVLWPLGGFTFCEPPPSGGPSADLQIALAGPLTHIPMALTWVVLYLAVHNGDLRDFSLTADLAYLSSDALGFCSTLFEQAVLLNIFFLWFNVFVPAFPLDGGRITASSMILLGVALDKTALLASTSSFVVGVALLAWSTYSFVDGVGTAGVFAFLVASFVVASAMQLFIAVKDREIRQDSLYGRECYYVNGTTPLPPGTTPPRVMTATVQMQTMSVSDHGTLRTEVVSDING